MHAVLIAFALLPIVAGLPGAPEPAGAAVVITRAPEGITVHIAYPEGTTEEDMRRDVEAIAVWSGWELSTPSFTQESPGVSSSFRVTGGAPGSQLTVWPFVAALAERRRIAVSYVGPGTPGQGRFENQHVTVNWQATTAGITYTVEVKRLGFRTLEELSAPPPAALVAVQRRIPWASIAGLLALALSAGMMTYYLARRVMLSQQVTNSPSAEEEGVRD